MFYFTAEALWRPLMSLHDSACDIAMQEEDHGDWSVQSEGQTEAEDEVHTAAAYDNAIDSRTERDVNTIIGAIFAACKEQKARKLLHAFSSTLLLASRC